jgi:hypothetical protein
VKLAFGCSLAAVGLAAITALSRPDQTPLKPLVGLVAVVLILGFAVASELSGDHKTTWQARFWGKSFLACLALIPALAAVPLAAIMLALRRGPPTYPTLVGALAGGAAAGIAVIGYGLFCNEDSSLFIATWYGLASLLTCGLGAVLGRYWLRW